MSLSDKQEAFRQSVWERAEETMGKEYLEYARKSNRKAVRDKIIAMNHYYHILQLMGAPELDMVQMCVYGELAREKIAGIKDEALRRRELIKLSVLSTHTYAWNIAHFHYERAVKTLCMMMVTLMDYMLREQGGRSVLYQESDVAGYETLLDEITALNDDYRDAFFSICAFDFCTKKLGDYLHVPEYDNMAIEHERIIHNGNPRRVTDIMERLKELAGEKQGKLMKQIEKAYTPEPLYSEKIFASCYREAVEQYETKDEAVDDFNGLVARVNSLYQSRVKQ